VIPKRRYVLVGTGHRARMSLDGWPVRSIAVGMAGNESLRTGMPVKIADLGLGVDVTRR
jgi:hypothetical protein